jgi:CheY-like chemotaxis protein
LKPPPAPPQALRILNVDDDEIARYVKTRILREGGHEVFEASSGGEALARLAAGGVDLAVLDVKLPDMSGFEVARRIRENPATSSLPIVQVSAICVTEDDERDGLQSGADAFIRPPLHPELLLEVAANVMRQRRSSSGVPRRELDPHSVHRVRTLVASHLKDSLTVRELAAAVGLSPFHFARQFKSATGMSPHEFVIHARLTEATRLLRETDLPLGEIAARVGYRTHAHFSSAFLAKIGTRPRAYRTEFRKAG